jgi:hypothetical protein
MVENWNGKTWRVTSNPNPGSSENELFGVDCIAGSNDCVAVGAYSDGTNYQTLVETR